MCAWYYEQRTWPQLDVSRLAPILSRRLQRRGKFPAVRTIAGARSGDEWVADFGVVEETGGSSKSSPRWRLRFG